MYNIDWIISKKDLVEWDDFLFTNATGHASQSSYWLSSYNSYGFNYRILKALDKNNKILGGLGIVISKFGFLKMASCPYGPIIAKGHEGIFEELIEESKKRVEKIGAIAYQINMPILKLNESVYKDYCLDISKHNELIQKAFVGNVIKEVIAINGFRSVHIKYNGAETYDNLFKTFNTNTRRNIRKSQKNGLSLSFAESSEEMALAYNLIEQNAKRKGYGVRAWNDFKSTLIGMVENNSCLIPICIKEGEILGVLIVFEYGQRLTYVMGGTHIGEQDLKVGHFLHNEMIKLSIEKQYNFYDISVGGSAGVTRFKTGFGGVHIKFIEPRYWIFKPILFKLYIKFRPFLKRHKSIVSKILKSIS